METFIKVLDIINIVIGALLIPVFFMQIVYLCLCWIKPKRFPESQEKKKIAVLIPAHNEAVVIGNTIDELLKQKYPRDKFDIFVVADNCTDNTAEIARSKGAIVFEREDKDPNHRRAAYPMKMGYQKILAEYKGVYDAVIKFDADNVAKDDYISKMNDALCRGVKIARGFLSSSNFNTNLISAINSHWVVRYSMVQAKVRERLGISANLTGAGLMVATDVLDKIDGWDCMSLGDDVEFAVKRIGEGYKTHFVHDAVMYEEQTYTIKDTWNRLSRISKGANRTLWKYCSKNIFKAHKDFANLDIALELTIMPISLIFVFWYPIYFILSIIGLSLTNNTEGLMALLRMCAIGLFGLFALQFIIQTLYLYIVGHKYFTEQKTSYKIAVILTIPLFMMFYSLTSVRGILFSTKWKSISRENPNHKKK